MVQIYEIVYPISVIPTQLLVGVFKPNKKSTPIFKKKKKKSISSALEKTRLPPEISKPCHLQPKTSFAKSKSKSKSKASPV